MKKLLILVFTSLELHQRDRLIGISLFIGVISLDIYPISRAAGAFYQSNRGNAIVNVSKTIYRTIYRTIN